jgi:hypothetical protein
LQAISLVDAFFVDSNLAPQDAIDVTFGDTLEMAEQEVVDTLSAAILVDFQKGDGFFAQTIHFEYTSPPHVVLVKRDVHFPRPT